VKIRIGLAQIEPALGLLDRNLETHLELIDRARRENVALLLFPELSLTGYLLKDMVPDISRHRDDPFFAPLLKAAKKLDLAFGFVEQSEDFRHFNSFAYLAEGQLRHVHRKIYLPTYGMFDEQRYFAQGDTLQAFPTRFGRLAVAVCEDVWHPSIPYLAFLDGAVGLLVPSASPVIGMEVTGEGLPTNAAWWDQLLRHQAGLYAGFLAFCNRCGVEDGSSYWGGSRLIAPDGAVLAEAPLHESGLTVAELDLQDVARRRKGFSLLRNERPEVTFRALERILRDRAGGAQGDETT